MQNYSVVYKAYILLDCWVNMETGCVNAVDGIRRRILLNTKLKAIIAVALCF